jgi:hypothetical protein
VALILELAAVRVLRDRPVKVIAVRPVKAARAVTVRPAMAGIASKSTGPQTSVSTQRPTGILGDVAVVSL